jgi:hypothetical protein
MISRPRPKTERTLLELKKSKMLLWVNSRWTSRSSRTVLRPTIQPPPVPVARPEFLDSDCGFSVVIYGVKPLLIISGPTYASPTPHLALILQVLRRERLKWMIASGTTPTLNSLSTSPALLECQDQIEFIRTPFVYLYKSLHAFNPIS